MRGLLILPSDIQITLSTPFQEFLKRFASIPDMLELDHLTVSGDVTFGKGVVLKVSKSYIIGTLFLGLV